MDISGRPYHIPYEDDMTCSYVSRGALNKFNTYMKVMA